MIHVLPSERYDRQAKSRDIPESLILKAIFEFGLNPGEAQATKLAGGFQNANYMIQDGARRLVFRFYANGAETAQREIGLLYHLRNFDVKIPRPAGVFEVDGKSIGVLEFVDGRPLQDHLTHGKPLPNQFRSVGRELAKIHRVEFDQCGFFGPQGSIIEAFDNFPGLARQYIEKVLEDVPRNRLSPAVNERLRRLIRDKWTLVEETEPSRRLTHSDFNPKNLMVAKGMDVVAVLDWEFSLSGNGYIDIGNFFRFLFDYPEGAREAFISGYTDVAGSIHPRWFEIARLLDLTNMCSFLERKEDDQRTFRTARWVIDGTLEFFGY